MTTSTRMTTTRLAIRSSMRLLLRSLRAGRVGRLDFQREAVAADHAHRLTGPEWAATRLGGPGLAEDPDRPSGIQGAACDTGCANQALGHADRAARSQPN